MLGSGQPRRRLVLNLSASSGKVRHCVLIIVHSRHRGRRVASHNHLVLKKACMCNLSLQLCLTAQKGGSLSGSLFAALQ